MNIFKHFLRLGTITFFSRIFGFIRDILIAYIFGASLETDAFFIAFKIPNLLRRIFAEGAFAQAFIPILSEYKYFKCKNTTKDFVSYISGLMILVLSVLTVLGIFFSNIIILGVAPGFSNTMQKLTLSILLLKFTFPYIFFISLSAFMSAILNTWYYFLIPAISPILLNVTIIVFVLFLSKYFSPPILSLGIAVLAGGVIQLVYQLPVLKKIGLLVIPHISFKNIGVYRVLLKMSSAILGVSASQISSVINTIFSSFFVSSSISCAYYADRLIEFPAGILGVSLSTILLPLLSKSISTRNKKEYSTLLNWGLRVSLILSFPCAIIVFFLAKQIITILFQYGKFTDSDVCVTQEILIAYSFGLVALILVKVLASGFYAYHDIKTPMKISIITLLITQFSNCILIIPFQYVGLAISISVSAWINALLLFYILYKKNMFYLDLGWSIFLYRLILSLIIMCIFISISIEILSQYNINKFFFKLIYLIFIFFIGGVSYFFSLFILGMRISDFYTIYKK
jgi:putative peptidoglycan lipid II flippase